MSKRVWKKSDFFEWWVKTHRQFWVIIHHSVHIFGSDWIKRIHSEIVSCTGVWQWLTSNKNPQNMYTHRLISWYPWYMKLNILWCSHNHTSCKRVYWSWGIGTYRRQIFSEKHSKTWLSKMLLTMFGFCSRFGSPAPSACSPATLLLLDFFQGNQVTYYFCIMYFIIDKLNNVLLNLHQS